MHLLHITPLPLPPPPPPPPPSSSSSSQIITLRNRPKRKNKERRTNPQKRQQQQPFVTPTPLFITPPPSQSHHLSKHQALTQVFHQLQSNINRGIPIEPSIFSSLLETCFHLNSPISHITLLHSLIPPSLLRNSADLSSKLLRLYAFSGRIEEAHQLFDLMPERNKTNAFPWNSLMAGYTEMGLYEDAMAVYYQMEEEGVEPDRFTFPRVLKACAGIGSVQHGEAVHRHIVRCGFGGDIFVMNALVDMYAKCGDIMKARQVFDRIVDRDSVSWNSMLTGYIRHGLVLEALETCRGMIDDGTEPDSITISAMLSRFSSFDELGLEIHGWVLRRGLEQNLSVANSLIGLYSERDELGRALMIFESMHEKDLVSWNAIISAHRRDPRVLSLFRQMEENGQRPDKVTFISLLSACANLRMVEDGQRLFKKMVEKYDIRPEMVHFGCMVNMLARAGLIDEAYEIILHWMPFDAGPTIWGALLFACSVHGNIDKGEVAAEKLFEMEPDNEHNFELMMKIYRNAGRFEGVERMRRLMRERGLESKSLV